MPIQLKPQGRVVSLATVGTLDGAQHHKQSQLFPDQEKARLPGQKFCTCLQLNEDFIIFREI